MSSGDLTYNPLFIYTGDYSRSGSYCNCPIPCERYTYTSRVSTAKFPSDLWANTLPMVYKQRYNVTRDANYFRYVCVCVWGGGGVGVWGCAFVSTFNHGYPLKNHCITVDTHQPWTSTIVRDPPFGSKSHRHAC